MTKFIKIWCTCRVHVASDGTRYSFCWLSSKNNRKMTFLKIFTKIRVIANNKILQTSMFVAKYHIGNQQQYYEN